MNGLDLIKIVLICIYQHAGFFIPGLFANEVKDQ